ncbi:MAG TPA: hypothetical protein VFO38_00410 [Candidatus Saccharimonadales bacterium]|nr:hypothetical protein [Candidatus Saccharimonadales bacterium]
MQQDASNAKQLIVERIRQSTNILVAVSASPSVDSLAAALGLALMLNKMDKHATAVFSGTLPPAIEFLEPGKTFENSVDSLRDFIISLDKEKADRLRYKVEDDVVRIFITPYRTIINENDLQFSQGDFNVDLILALGVEKRDDLDKAIVAHGRILHDATVMTINANNQQSTLGAVDWHDQSASSLSEMLVGLVEALAQPNLLDQQTATALLTGIVAATDRFSNQNTTPRVMTMAAQLMAAGANQQLIANNLVKAHELPQVPNNGQLVPDGPSVKVAVEQPKPNGELDISHPKKEEPAAQPVQQPQQQQPRPEKQRGKKGKQRSAEDELAAALPQAAAAQNDFEQLKSAIKEDVAAGGQSPLDTVKAPGSQTVNGASASEEDTPKEENSYVVGNGSWRGRRLEPPTLGGTLNATTEQAMDDAKKAEERDRNQKLLTHPDSPQKSKAKTVEPPVQQQDEPAKAELAPAKDQPEQSKKAKNEPAPPVEATVEAPVLSSQPAPADKVEAPAVAPLQEPVAPAPEPEPVAAPPMPAPEPAPLPEPPAAPQEPAAPALPPEPAPSAAPAAPPANLDEARKAVDDALATQPFNPAGQPLESVGAMPLEATPPPVETPALPPLPDAAQAAASAPLPPAPALPGLESLPPLPPMPPLPQQDSTQPLPPPPSISDLPPLPSNIPAAPVAPPQAVLPQEPAAPQAPADPKQFQIPS